MATVCLIDGHFPDPVHLNCDMDNVIRSYTKKLGKVIDQIFADDMQLMNTIKPKPFHVEITAMSTGTCCIEMISWVSLQTIAKHSEN